MSATTGTLGLSSTRKVGKATPANIPINAKAHKAAKETYEPMAATARGVKIHQGPLKLRDAKKPPERTLWVKENKKYHPYSYFESPANRPTTPPKKPQAPPALWFPQRAKEPKKKTKDSEEKDKKKEEGDDDDSDDLLDDAEKLAIKAAKEEKKQKNTTMPIAERPPWDSEHHVMYSRMNHEVQRFCREYFDKPKRKESDGVPRVRELYAMNDRQMGWNDEPNPEGNASRRTYLDNLGPWNVAGPKEQQLPSYWRKGVKRTSSEPNPFPDRITAAQLLGLAGKPSEQNVLQRLAEMPADKSVKYWQEWSKHKANRSSSEGATERMRRTWDDRWSVTHGKDNEHMCKGQHQYFSSAQYLSGVEVGHPGALLGLKQMKWRNVAKNVSMFAVGTEGRGSSGRHTILT